MAVNCIVLSDLSLVPFLSFRAEVYNYLKDYTRERPQYTVIQ